MNTGRHIDDDARTTPAPYISVPRLGDRRGCATDKAVSARSDQKKNSCRGGDGCGDFLIDTAGCNLVSGREGRMPRNKCNKVL
jgi:hypothetical protein